MLNKVHLIGQVTKDPEVRMCPDGTVLLKFFIVTTENIVTKTNEKKQLTENHQIKVFNANSFLQKSISKGKLVYVEGKIKTETYFTNNDEQKTAVIINAYNVRILNDKVPFRMRPKQPINSESTLHLDTFSGMK